MAQPTYGNGNDGLLIADIASGSTTPVYLGPVDLRNQDIVGVQLETERQGRFIDVLFGTDAVVASTHTWTFANGMFVPGDVTGSLRVANAANANNNATVTISSRTDQHTIVTTGTQTNETFAQQPNPPNNPSIQLSVFVIDAGVNQLTGTWTIEGSNNYIPPMGAGATSYGEPQFAGRWQDVTALFGTIAAVAASPNQQYFERATALRSIRFKFVPSAGGGRIRAIVFAKSNG